MRVTVSHNKPVADVKQSLDRGFNHIFGGLPVGNVEITDVERTWVDSTMNFSMVARAGFINIPLKGVLTVEEKQVIIDLDLPPFVSQFIPEQKVSAVVEGQVRGLIEAPQA